MKDQYQLSRRNFLKIVAVAGSAGLAVTFGLDQANQPQTVSVTRVLMGTIVNLTIIGAKERDAKAAITACLDRMETLENVLSRFLPDSQVSIFNRDGQLENANPALVHLIEESKSLSELTGGAFDISVKPLIDLYQNAGALPPSAEIEAVRQLVGHDRIQVYGSDIAFSIPGMAITLDGIAKGYIVDAGISVLNALGFENVLVEAGGDLVASGNEDTENPWKIGIRSPRESQPGFLAQVNVSEQAVATSGDYFQYFSKDLRHHHIIDPRIGFSSPELASVTILGGSAMKSDALATAVMVMGIDAGLELLDRLDGVDGYLITKSMGEFKTERFE